MDMYEAVTGARMHAAYYRPGGVYVICRIRCRNTRSCIARTQPTCAA